MHMSKCMFVTLYIITIVYVTKTSVELYETDTEKVHWKVFVCAGLRSGGESGRTAQGVARVLGNPGGSQHWSCRPLC